MHIYVTRHGETTWNAENRLCGTTDVELNETGIAQAHKLAREMEGKNIDILISSPMKRALATSRIISDVCDIPVITDSRLTEQNYGIYEGGDRRDEAFLENKKRFAYKYPGGESMMQVAARVYPLLDEIRADYRGRNVLIVCHGGVCRVIRTYFVDMTNEEFFRYGLGNCRVEDYVID